MSTREPRGSARRPRGTAQDPRAEATVVLRRRTLRVVAGAVVLLLAVLYALSAEPRQGQPVELLTGPITLVTPPDFTFGAQRQWAVDCWNLLYPDERVTYYQLPRAADDQRAELMTKLQAGHDGYDVVGLDVVWTQEFAKARLIRPLDEVAELAYGDAAGEHAIEATGFLDAARESARFEGRDWAVPMHSNVALLYYNTDLVSAGEVPATWEQLAAFLRDRPTDDRGAAGYLGQFDDYEGLHANAAEFVWAHGGAFVDPSGHVTADEPGTVAGLVQLASGFREGWIPTEALGWTEGDSLQAFRNGDAVFLRHWPYAYGVLNATDSPVAGKVGVTQLPGAAQAPGPNTFGGANLAVPAGGRHPRTAYEFMRFMASEPIQRRTLEQGGYPASVREVYGDGAPPAAAPADPRIETDCERVLGSSEPLRVDQHYRETLRDAFAHTRSRPATPYYDRVTKLIQDAVHGVLERAAQQAPGDGDAVTPVAEDPGEQLRSDLETLSESLREAIRGR